MKKIMLIAGSVLLLFMMNGPLHAQGVSTDSPDGPFQKYYENGQLKMEGTYKDGHKEGEFKTYFEDGKLHQEENYKDGRMDGVSRLYSRSGQLKREATYKDGELQGQVKEYDQ